MGSNHEARVYTLLLALGVALGVAAHTALADDWERGPNRNKEKAKPCTSYKLETPYRGYGYDHTVTIENTCKHTEHCTVKASSNDDVLTLDVPGESTRSLIVRKGSPAREFSADVKCAE